jgi:outer membrane protein assembly factor BamD
LALLLLGATTGCSLLPELKDQTEGWSANQLYSAGKEALGESNYEDAIRYYEILQARYPFGRYAQQAALETAYAYYRYDEPDSALSSLDQFIRTYPRHPFVDYAYYLKGLVNFYRTTSFLDRIIPADPTRTDSAAARQAFQDFDELVRRFPESVYTEDARQRMIYLHNNLAAFEVNVADYYMRRGAYVAAVNRGSYVVQNFPRAPAVEDALAIMAEAYIELGMLDLARDTTRVLSSNVPDSAHLVRISQRLQEADKVGKSGAAS